MRALLFYFALAHAACASINMQLVGVMADSKQMRFAIRANEGARTRWVSLGEKMAGFVLISYDSEKQALTLQNDTERIELKLPESRVQAATDKFIRAPERIQEAAKAMAEVLKAENENPFEFLSTIEEKEGTIVFHLWHKESGGKGRDIVYDFESRKASKSRYWQ
jgi:hypothetical protein